MSTHRYVDRSRIETTQHCARERWLCYEQDGTGIEPLRKSIYLIVGGSVHVGLAVLLQQGQIAYAGGHTEPAVWRIVEEAAVAAALADFALVSATGIEPPPDEALAMATLTPIADLQSQLESSLGQPAPEIAADLARRVEGQRNEFDAYLQVEQAALVEAMVRAYARRRLRPLLAEFEVLEVEREGTWTLALDENSGYGPDATEIVFMSRPDALLRERSTNALHLLSYKTAASWDVRKARDAERDMQGLSEGIEVERRLAEWWQELHSGQLSVSEARTLVPSPAMYDYLHSLDAPPRILAVRMEYLLKGDRWRDRDLAARFGFDARSQKSPLLRRYVATSTPARRTSTTAAYEVGDSCVSWEYSREDGLVSKLAWQNWESRPVFDDMTIAAWIDLLDAATETMSSGDSTIGIEPHPVGWSTPAQSLGYLPRHPLDEVFIPPITVFRNEDDLRDLVEQMEAQEVRVAEGAAAVTAATDEGERRSLLNRHFPMTRRACEYPTSCPMIPVCFGGEDIRRVPLESGKYRRREPHHEPELVAIRGGSHGQ